MMLRDQRGYIGDIHYIERSKIVKVTYQVYNGQFVITLGIHKIELGAGYIPDRDSTGEIKTIKNNKGDLVPRQKEVPFMGSGSAEEIAFNDEGMINEFMSQYAPNQMVRDPEIEVDSQGTPIVPTTRPVLIYEGILLRREQLKKYNEALAAKEKWETEEKEKKEARDKEIAIERENQREELLRQREQQDSKIIDPNKQEPGKVVSMDQSNS